MSCGKKKRRKKKKKKGGGGGVFYLRGQGHIVGLYNRNMTVSTISVISSKPVSLLQANSI